MLAILDSRRFKRTCRVLFFLVHEHFWTGIQELNNSEPLFKVLGLKKNDFINNWETMLKKTL